MGNFTELLNSDIRRSILELLNQDCGYTLNDFIIQGGLKGLGYAVSIDNVRCQLAWLAEQSLVTVERSPSVMVATATARGCDVAEGLALVPGISRKRARG